MRSAIVVGWFVGVCALAACAPKVAPKGPSTGFDEDLPSDRTVSSDGSSSSTPPPIAERPVAPVGKGVRTGTIDRTHLVAVLDGGPGAFLGQLEVSAHLDGDRFVGWQLVQVLDHDGALAGVDVAPGDVLLAINGKPIAKPDQLHAVWESLRTANQIVAELWRGPTKVELVFDVQPKI
jgi:hypothetical protein